MVEALAIYIQNMLPKLVTLLQSLASVTQNIMLGRSLTVYKYSEITNLLKGVAESDLYNQCYPERWEPYTLEEAAKSAATKFRRSINMFSYEAACRRHDGNMSCIMSGS
jgi:L-arabinose isomerase